MRTLRLGVFFPESTAQVLILASATRCSVFTSRTFFWEGSVTVMGSW